MKQKLGARQENGWQYYVERKIAWWPLYVQGELIWLRHYWMTYPVDAGGKIIELYRSYYRSDPRTETACL